MLHYLLNYKLKKINMGKVGLLHTSYVNLNESECDDTIELASTIVHSRVDVFICY